jgi:hypothetical protein
MNKYNIDTSKFQHNHLWKQYSETSSNRAITSREFAQSKKVVFMAPQKPGSDFIEIDCYTPDGNPFVVSVNGVLDNLTLNKKKKPQVEMYLNDGAFEAGLKDISEQIEAAANTWFSGNTKIKVLSPVWNEKLTAGWQYNYGNLLPIGLVTDSMTKFISADKFDEMERVCLAQPPAKVRMVIHLWGLHDKQKNMYVFGIKPYVQEIEIK